MPTPDPRVDAYIAHAANFAKPILLHIRKLVHAACPQVAETMKWSFPHFDCKGTLCSMAAFKQHCALGFWKGELIFGQTAAAQATMGHFGRLTSLADLPGDKLLIGYIKKAVKLNEAGVKKPAPTKSSSKRELVVPDYFMAALKKNKQALTAFENFSYSHRKEYVEWIVEAKREETRVKRLATALEWLAEGKARNWKYERC